MTEPTVLLEDTMIELTVNIGGSDLTKAQLAEFGADLPVPITLDRKASREKMVEDLTAHMIEQGFRIEFTEDGPNVVPADRPPEDDPVLDDVALAEIQDLLDRNEAPFPRQITAGEAIYMQYEDADAFVQHVMTAPPPEHGRVPVVRVSIPSLRAPSIRDLGRMLTRAFCEETGCDVVRADDVEGEVAAWTVHAEACRQDDLYEQAVAIVGAQYGFIHPERYVTKLPLPIAAEAAEE